MLFWTVMIIQYVVEGEQITTKLLFPTEQACAAAMTPIYKEIYKHYGESLAVCKPTDIPSGSKIRPKARPKITG